MSDLGLCNYYRKIFHDYSTIVGPLTALLKKTMNVRRHSGTLLTLRSGTCKQIQCCDESQIVFDLLKTALTSSSVLAYPDISNLFILTTTLRFIIGQFDDNGQERASIFGGRSFNKHERNYFISERECFTSMEGIKNYHIYLTRMRTWK